MRLQHMSNKQTNAISENPYDLLDEVYEVTETLINGIIYKATNIVNGKVYIGLTTKSLNHRKTQHEKVARGSKNCHHFQRSITKYGSDNFIWEELDTAGTIPDLKQLEQDWVWMFHSDNPTYGYNKTKGGDGGLTVEAILKLKEIAATPENKRKVSLGTIAGQARMTKEQHDIMELNRLAAVRATYKSGTHPNTQKITCPHCNKTGGYLGMRINHFDKCKLNPDNKELVAAKLRQKLSREKVRKHLLYNVKIYCPHCHKGVNLKSRNTFHFGNCSRNPLSKTFRMEHYKRVNGLSNLDVSCPHCGVVGHGGNMTKWHFDNCKVYLNSIGKPRELSLRMKVAQEENKKKWSMIAECPYCHKRGKLGPLQSHHFNNCKHNPKYTQKDKVSCPHCGAMSDQGHITRHHMGNCQQHPDNIGKDRELTHREYLVSTTQTCPVCYKVGKGATFYYKHFDWCLEDPKNTERKIKYQDKLEINRKRGKPKEKVECPHCGKIGCIGGTMLRYHFDNCDKNPYKIVVPVIKVILVCPHCSKTGTGAGMNRHHFNNCKLKNKKGNI